jgi:DNA-binding NarL/FixJ family response regulator
LKKRILITDDHTIVRRGVVSVLKEYFPFADLIEADSLQTSIDALSKDNFDLIILDLNLPDANAENLVKSIRSQFTKLPIIVFSMFPKEVMEGPMSKLGVVCYINKSENLLLLKEAVDNVFHGNKVQYKLEVEGHAENPFEELSPKELTVMFSLLEGHSNKEICDQMGLKASTVATYKQRVFEKLAIQNTTQLVKLAIQFNVYHLSQ